MGLLSLIAEKSIYDDDNNHFNPELCFANSIICYFSMTNRRRREAGRSLTPQTPTPHHHFSAETHPELKTHLCGRFFQHTSPEPKKLTFFEDAPLLLPPNSQQIEPEVPSSHMAIWNV